MGFLVTSNPVPWFDVYSDDMRARAAWLEHGTTCKWGIPRNEGFTIGLDLQ